MRTITTFALLSLVLYCTSPASAAPVYNIVPLGLDDLEHTRNDGYKYSTAQQLNGAGQVRGYSERYNDVGGRSAWLYDGATTINIGLTGSEHTRSDGFRFSWAVELNETGQVSGGSYRYYDNAEMGQTAWLYDGATTIDIGFSNSEHTRHDGYRYSNVVSSQLNETGQVLGNSKRYNGSFDMGQTAWLYDGANSNAIGLTDTEHTRINGYRYSGAYELNEAGQVRGYSHRYNGGSTELGQSAWLFDGATTINIGLVGSEHTRNDGRKISYTEDLNEAGQVLGYSWRYNGGSAILGYSTWLYDGATTIDIGLTGTEHTGFNGYKYSHTEQLNEAGQVIGYSHRFGGITSWLGLDAWFYNGVTTTAIGLTGPDYERYDGYTESTPHRLNEAGHVIGYSNRYNGGITELGPVAWLYDGVTTSVIGLIGPEYTRINGYNFGWAQHLNEAGQVSGYSVRYNGGSLQLGQDAWFFDPLLDQTFSLQLSVRSDGYAYSEAQYLGDDGLTLGTYTLFDELDNDLGRRAFYFSVAEGLHDLGPVVDGGLSANGWDFLADAIRANGFGQILGHGKLSSQSGGQMAYLLTPVPEPNGAVLTGLAMLMVTIMGCRPRGQQHVRGHYRPTRRP